MERKGLKAKQSPTLQARSAEPLVLFIYIYVRVCLLCAYFRSTNFSFTHIIDAFNLAHPSHHHNNNNNNTAAAAAAAAVAAVATLAIPLTAKLRRRAPLPLQHTHTHIYIYINMYTYLFNLFSPLSVLAECPPFQGFASSILGWLCSAFHVCLIFCLCILTNLASVLCSVCVCVCVAGLATFCH